MCGLAGFVTRAGAPEDRLRATAEAMAATLRPRGPDDGGVWCDARAGVALGFRRLSIIDLSDAGRQPMVSACGRWTLVYNGEVYNAAELRDDLVRAGKTFRGHSDTEVLLEGCAAWGVRATLEKLIGMFAFAAWDGAEQKLYLARDRLGIKPLYYGAAGRLFLFGSELKALRAHPEWTPHVSPLAAASFLRFMYVPNPLSIYSGIHALAPGAMLVRGAGGETTIEHYWQLTDIIRAAQKAPFDGGDGEAVEELERLLSDAVRRRMIADVPLGVFLSGGIDSSTVVALMQSLSARPVRTFSIGFEEGDEAPHAAAVAQHLGTDHTELYVTSADALRVIPKLADVYDEPFADPSMIPTFILSELTRRNVTVALSGDGGDELFAGYGQYPLVLRRNASRADAFKRTTRKTVTELWDRIPESCRPPRLEDFMRHQRQRLAVGEGRMRYHRINAWHHRELMPHIGDAEVTAAIAEPGGLLGDALSRMLFIDTLNYLPDDILTKVDRASMAVSLEVRVPILDHRVVAFAWSLPNRFKLRGRESKWVLRNVLYKHVPRKLIDRPKQGFVVSYSNWLRGPLREWAEDLLSEKSLNAHGLFQPLPVRRQWQEHLSGRRNHETNLWTALMFQAWWRRWMG
ncbi:MAG: asparagine synthase (glutamine-hydrolyzing) [Gammaproteobacteria bacterium]|nr:asparagine synthase (glutamine-hydrolyzing) [Gammaproteobacteria bacterium]